MLAARWHGLLDLRVEEVPVPEPGPGDVLLRVRWCGICGTDVEEYREGPVVIPTGAPNPLTGQSAPVTMGHEFSGEIVAIGEGVTGLAIGDRVVPEICLYCGDCFHCRRREYALCTSWAAVGLHGDGGLAEYARVSAGMCVRLPDEIGDEDAALIETTEVAVRAIRKGGVRPGDSVAIVGDGAVGLITMQVAAAAGATSVLLLGHREPRLGIGRNLGATATIATRDPGWRERVLELTEGRGADVAIEAGGRADAIDDAIASTRKGGTIVLLAVIGGAVPIHVWPIVEGERTLVGSVQHHFDEDLPAAVDLLASGRVRVAPLITRRIGLRDIVASGFASPSPADVKVLVSTEIAPAV